MLAEVQRSKGKWYSEVMARFYASAVAERTREHLDGLVGAVRGTGINRSDLVVVARRLRQGEFSGTTYMPLPDEAAIIRTVREVQREGVGRRAAEERAPLELEPVDMSEYEGMSEEESWNALVEKAYRKLGGR